MPLVTSSLFIGLSDTVYWPSRTFIVGFVPLHVPAHYPHTPVSLIKVAQCHQRFLILRCRRKPMLPIQSFPNPSLKVCYLASLCSLFAFALTLRG